MTILKKDPTSRARALVAWNGVGLWPKDKCIALRANQLPQISNPWWWLDNFIYWTVNLSWYRGFKYMQTIWKRESPKIFDY